MRLRLLLIPFSVLYALLTLLRNKLYDLTILPSQSHAVKTIVVGNLSVGGTGKSPFVYHLMTLLENEIKLGILSRGYGRNTKGFYSVTSSSLANEVGDEPLMFHELGSDKINVAVCENRNEGIKQLVSKFPNTECVILDDAFQHRQLNAGFNILLTTFQNPFFYDFILPAGNLRESRMGAIRSNVIIVTKCPENLSESQKEVFQKKLYKYHKPVFFSKIIYGELKSFTYSIENINSVLIVAGIANPDTMVSYLKSHYRVKEFLFSDHHNYTLEDIQKIHQKFDTFVSESKAIVTTFKDYMRLKDKRSEWGLDKYPWYILPISIEIDREKEFVKLVKEYVG
jgi:tetraacyldisaccharide 4'-kinase